MRILIIFTLGLIAGIVAEGATVQSGEPRPTDERTHVHLLGYGNTTLEEIEEFDTKLCEKHGGSGAYDDYKERQRQLDTCFGAVQSEIFQEVFADGPVRPEDMYRKYCSKSSKFENCLKNFTDSIKTCLDVSRHETANVMFNVFSSVLEYMCEHDGIRIGMFIRSGGDECLRSKTPDLELCANHTLLQYVREKIPSGAELGGLGKLHLLVPDVQKCTVFNKFEACALDQLKGCSDQTAADFATSIFQMVKKITTCNRLVKSKASKGNFVDVLLITAVTAMMSLHFV